MLADALAAAPNLRLVLKDNSDAALRTLYPEARFPGAVVLPFSDSHTDFMARFNEVEFIADSQPYSGTTITCAALYMGVPVLTLLAPGARHVSNVSAALLLHVQRALDADGGGGGGGGPALPARLDETFLVRSEREYVERMAWLGAQGDAWWAGWRRARRSIARAFRAAMDPAAFVAELEGCYEAVVREAAAARG